MKFFTLSFYKEILGLLIETVNEFMNDKALRLSAALAYYTIFSIAPLLLIVIWLVGFLYGEHIDGQGGAQNEIFEEFAAILGTETAAQVQDVIQRISVSDKSGIGIAVGIGTLIIGSTTIFIQIQDSINFIWKVRPKPKQGWKLMLLNRVISFSMVIGLGFLLITSLILNGIIAALSSQLNEYIPGISVYMIEWINIGITFVVITLLFGFIFRFLPDARVRLVDILGGAIFTALLFMLGRYLIGLYMQYTAPGSAYGAAGSIIVLLVWIYYSAAILYFGAEFTKVYANKYGKGVIPAPYAVRIIQTESETERPKAPEKDTETTEKVSEKKKE